MTVNQSHKADKINCQYCFSNNIVKRGKRINKLKVVQIFYCKECKKRFTSEKIKNKTYDIQTIVKSISFYNKGLTIDVVSEKTNIPRSTISNWIVEYKELFNLSKYYRELQAFSQNNVLIESYKFVHNLVYLYQQHNFKLNKFIYDKETGLYEYLLKAKNGKFNSKIFIESNNRASNTKLNILQDIAIKKINNNACKFVDIAVQLVNENRERHNAVEKIMLENDSSTIAVEVPVLLQLSKSTIPWIRSLREPDSKVWLSIAGRFDASTRSATAQRPLTNTEALEVNEITSNDYITGHIDILQYRNNKLYILDYKPKADKEKPIGQLFIYACCLSKATGIPFSKIKIAWFDETVYYETGAMDVYKEVMKRFKY